MVIVNFTSAPTKLFRVEKGRLSFLCATSPDGMHSDVDGHGGVTSRRSLDAQRRLAIAILCAVLLLSAAWPGAQNASLLLDDVAATRKETMTDASSRRSESLRLIEARRPKLMPEGLFAGRDETVQEEEERNDQKDTDDEDDGGAAGTSPPRLTLHVPAVMYGGVVYAPTVKGLAQYAERTCAMPKCFAAAQALRRSPVMLLHAADAFRALDDEDTLRIDDRTSRWLATGDPLLKPRMEKLGTVLGDPETLVEGAKLQREVPLEVFVESDDEDAAGTARRRVFAPLTSGSQLRPYYGQRALQREFSAAGSRLPQPMKWFSDAIVPLQKAAWRATVRNGQFDQPENGTAAAEEDIGKKGVTQKPSDTDGAGGRRKEKVRNEGGRLSSFFPSLPGTSGRRRPSLAPHCRGGPEACGVTDAPPDYATCPGGLRNAGIGYAVSSQIVQYGRGIVQPFIESFLRYAGPCDDLVLFAESWLVTETFTTGPGKGRVIVHNVANWDTPRAGHPFVDRLWVFRAWIESAWKDYHFILHVDTRDTIFFGNPFAFLHRVRFEGLFSVTEVHEFQNQGINRMWVETHYEDKIHTVPFFNNYTLRVNSSGPTEPIPVLCSGLYGGTSLAVADYIQAFVTAVEKTRHLLHVFGIDQGVHIALQYVELAMAGYHHPIYAIDFRVGPYRHWYSEDERVRRDVLGRHLNCLGQTYAIVHQLDRYRDHHFNDVNSDYSVRGTRAAPAVAPGAPVTRTFGDADRFDAPSREWLQSRAAVVRRAAANARRSMRGAAPARRLLRPSGVCRARHVALAFVEPNTAHFGAVQAFVAAYQRYHPACDDLVLFVASAVWMDALARDESGGSGNVVGVVYPHGARPGVSFVDWLARYGGRYDGIAAFDSVAAPPVSIFGNVFTGTGLSTATRTAAARTPGIVYAVHDPAFAAGCGWSPGTVGTPLMPGVFLGTTPAAVDWLATQNDLGADSGREWCANASVAARSLIAGSLFPLVSRSALVVLAGPMAAVQVVGPGAASPWGQDHAGRPLHAGGGVVAAVVGEGGVRAEFLKDYRVRHSKFPSACFTSHLK